MTTTTSYGDWGNRVDPDAPTANVEEYVARAFGSEGADGFDFDAIVRDYRAAVDRALPPGVTLSGNEFIGPAHPKDSEFGGYPHVDGHLDIGHIVEGVDLFAIIERHMTAT